MRIEIINRKEDVDLEAVKASDEGRPSESGVLQTSVVYKKLGEARQKGHTLISAQGSSRSSKTYNIVLWLIVYMLKYPHSTVSIVRATRPAIEGSVFRDFKNVLLRLGLFDERCLNKTSMIYTFPNGSFAEFFSTDTEQKLRGRKRHVLFVNEANELSLLEWKQLKMRTTKFSILDYNPSFDDDHWISGLNKHPRTYHFISTYKDNPFLEQVVIDEIESYKESNPTLWQIYGLGQQAIVEGVIFPNIEIVEEFPPFAKHIRLGLDFGYSHDPTAAVMCGLIGKDLYMDELFYETHMLTGDIIRKLKPYAHYRVVSESADPRLIQEIRNGGINIHPAEKGAGSIKAGISKMQELNLKVTRRSYNLLKEGKKYVYQQTRDGQWLNEPVDAFNHLMDAARYYVNETLLGKQNKPTNDLEYFGIEV
jgi:phage terminase large subunit